MIIEPTSHFPEKTIRIYAVARDFAVDTLPGAADLPGIATAWAQIPDLKYRTLFGPDGTIAYLVKIDPTAPAAALRGIARKLAHRERERMTKEIAFYWHGAAGESMGHFLNGFFLGTYRAGHWRGDFTPHPMGEADSTLFLVGEATGMFTNIAKDTYAMSHTQLRCMDLVNAPANKKRPQDLAAWAEASAKAYNYQATIMDKAACEAEGMHALLAVNRGSEDPAQFIILEYKGAESSAGPIVLAGKGVTFDTGGVSIKDSMNLHLMKSDMGGAAAVLGTIETAARLRLPVHLFGLVPATDNSVDAMSIKPSDVINSHSGRTIEIIDTDAEGRLILSDALSYAVKYLSPSTLIDLATLTGSAVRTFGYECAALFSQNDNLLEEIRQAGDRCGERCWPLPMWESYRKGLASDVADIKNYSGKPINGAIDAAIFLESFTQEHPRFAHLDIAGVALQAGPFGKDRMATAFGVHLLVEWLRGTVANS